jgi:hypothetical protein
MSTWQGVYFFAIAFSLAMLEIQIEGPHGWAAKLPTWRWEPSFMKRAGRPVTGYHLWLTVFMLLLLHLPQGYLGFSWEREAELLSLFLLLAVVWDFLWFAFNPHFGLARFNREHVWWFRNWVWRVPADYLLGLVGSAAAFLVTSLLRAGLPERALQWGVFAGSMLLLTASAVALRAFLRPRPVGAPVRRVA